MYGLVKIHVLQKGSRFKEQITRKVRCVVGEYACVDKEEIETGEERELRNKFSVQENESEKWLEDGVKKVSKSW